MGRYGPDCAVMNSSRLPEPLRRDLLRYLGGTSEERAQMIHRLTAQQPDLADLLMDLEADYDLPSRFEIELLRSL